MRGEKGHVGVVQCSTKGCGWTLDKMQFVECGRECVGDVRLETQADVEQFGSRHCTKIVGSLVITGSVTSLEPLSGLRHVTEDFFIQLTDALVTLRGLESLRVVNGSFQILENSALESVAALRCLQQVGGGVFSFVQNAKTRFFGCFNRLHSVNNIFVVENESLEAICGFNSRKLKQIEGMLVAENPNLRKVTGLQWVRSAADFVCRFNEKCEKIAVLPRASSLSLSLASLPQLRCVADFPAAKEMSENLTFTNLPLLQHLPSFPCLRDLQPGLIVSRLPALKDIDALSNLRSIDNGILLFETGLRDLDGFINLQSVTGDVNISSNVNLLNIDGFSGLETYENGIFALQGNTLLADFCGLQPLANQNPQGPPPIFAIFNAENPTKEQIAVLPPCEMCKFVRSALQRWLDDGSVTPLTECFLLADLSTCSVAHALRYRAISGNQARILRGALDTQGERFGADPKALNLCCFDDTERCACAGSKPCRALTATNLRFAVATQCKKE